MLILLYYFIKYLNCIHNKASETHYVLDKINAFKVILNYALLHTIRENLYLVDNDKIND